MNYKKIIINSIRFESCRVCSTTRTPSTDLRNVGTDFSSLGRSAIAGGMSTSVGTQSVVVIGRSANFVRMRSVQRANVVMSVNSSHVVHCVDKD